MIRFCNGALGTTFLIFILAGGSSAGAEQSALLEAVGSIQADQLKRHVDVLADDSFEGREAGSQGGRAAAIYLLKQIEKHGLQGAGDDGGFFQSFGSGYRNILGLLEGSDPKLKDEIVIVCAHYDHVGYGTARNSRGPTGYIHNGADDNASGMAGLLETIEAFSKLSERPRRSILFAFWDGEEKGLIGSKHWIAHPTCPLAQVAIVINLDMIGRLSNERLKVFGTRTGRGLRSFVSRHNGETNLELDFSWVLKANSDHHPFYAKSIPILMLHTGLHSDYHRPSDDAHKVNPEGMQRITRLLFQVVHELADRQERSGFRTASRQETPESRLRLERPLARLPSRFGVRWQRPTEKNGKFTLTFVADGSAADRAGLRVGDRLLRFAGRRVSDQQQFITDVLAAKNPVSVVVQRPGEEKPRELTVRLYGKPVRVGVSWRQDGAEPGTVLLTRVVPGSSAYLAGMKTGDRIYRVANKTFAGSDELLKLFNEAEGTLEVLIERSGRLQTLQLELPGSVGSDASTGSDGSTKSFSKS